MCVYIYIGIHAYKHVYIVGRYIEEDRCNVPYHLSMCLSVCLSTCPFTFLFLSLSVSLYIIIYIPSLESKQPEYG